MDSENQTKNKIEEVEVKGKTNSKTSGIKRRGLAALSPERRREIASMGGKAGHEMGKAHQFSSEEARAAIKRRFYEPEEISKNSMKEPTINNKGLTTGHRNSDNNEQKADFSE